jgi:hypothetical protein
MGLIRARQFDPRTRKFSEALFNVRYIVEVRAIAPGCGMDDEAITSLVQLGCRSVLLLSGIDRSLYINQKGDYALSEIVVIAEDLDSVEHAIALANGANYARVVEDNQRAEKWGIKR